MPVSHLRNKTPRLGYWLLKLFSSTDDRVEILGDFAEGYTIKLGEKGRVLSWIWFWAQIALILPVLIKNKLYWSVMMFESYLKSAFRNLHRHKWVSFIKVSGLALGMTCAILIFLWVNQQFGFDKSQKNADRIYRLEAVDWVDMATAFRNALTQFPEILEFVQFNSWERPTLKYRDRLFEMDNFVFADHNVFDVFSFSFLQGKSEKALEAPFSLVLTESEARRIFGNEDPVGKMIKYDNTFDFTVTAIIEDVDDFHIEVKAMASFEDLPIIKARKNFLNEHNWNFATYLMLADYVDIPKIEDKVSGLINDMLRSLGGQTRFEETDFFLRPFNEIYFANNLKAERGVKHGNRQMVFLFSAIALFILMIACVNFINLTTARSSVRGKEISIRKVVGANRRNLIWQFMGETLLLSLIALSVSIILVRFVLPRFNLLVGENLILDLFNGKFVLGILAIFIVAGFFAGVYPAFHLSAMMPNQILKGQLRSGVKTSPLRKVLIVFQFSIAIFLIGGTLIVFRQIDFMMKQDLGFNQEQILNVPLKGELLGASKELFKQRLLQHPDILKLSFASQEPGEITNTNTWAVRGERKSMKIVNTDPDYVDLMELEILDGRNLSWQLNSDRATKYIINEAAAKFLGFESPVGEMVSANFGESEIIGVVKDYHFNSLHNAIIPMAIVWYERWADIAHIKISGRNTSRCISHIETVWSEMCPDFLITFEFLDESFAARYHQEKRLAEILRVFVFLSVILSCLGLFGLSAFIAERRTKEIGIRKVLGSSVVGIVFLLSKDFSRWILYANAFAWPMVYFVARTWLQNYPFRTNLSFWIFIISTGIALGVALFTISYHSIRAATANPVHSLRYE
jgi:putative ABC transport system permease protein